jgi:hypothetical protein
MSDLTKEQLSSTALERHKPARRPVWQPGGQVARMGAG